MLDSLVNLDTVWDLATENREVFSEEDLGAILEAHFGEELAKALRNKDTVSLPCYKFIPCEECDYLKFCVVRREAFSIRSKEECQKKLKSFVSSFPSQ